MLHDESSTEFGAISPMMEMGAYEWLWQQEQQGERKVSFKVLAELFRDHPGHWPSELVSTTDAQACAEEVLARLRKRGVKSFSVAGTRKPSPEGLRRTSKLVSLLVKEGVTIVSGLAKGIDTMAHQTAIERGGDTIAVIGTPIDQAYPKENTGLQERIARDFLLISQVPVLLYARRPPSVNRLFFPERNITMSALTQATVIVEAGETSGTLIQARAAFKQGRKLFILESNFQNPKLTWPRRFEEQGAIRVRDFDDILANLDASAAAAQG